MNYPAAICEESFDCEREIEHNVINNKFLKGKIYEGCKKNHWKYD